MKTLTSMSLAIALGFQPSYAQTAEQGNRAIGSSANAKQTYTAALKAVQNYDYSTAINRFIETIDHGPSNNKYYFDAVKWLSKKDGDKLFKHKLQHTPRILNGERAVLEWEIEKARKLSDKDPRKKELLARAQKRLKRINDLESKLGKKFESRIQK